MYLYMYKYMYILSDIHIVFPQKKRVTSQIIRHEVYVGGSLHTTSPE